MINKKLSNELNNPGRKTKSLTRSSNQCPQYDTGEQVCTIEEYQNCIVIFDGKLQHKQKDIHHFSPMVDMEIF